MRSLLKQIVRSINRTAYDRAIADELHAHIELHVADNIRRGMDPATARRDAFLRLGGVQQTMELCWDVGTIRWLARLLQSR
ncbi:MAG: permease prefix domain 1-containing protein [Vicinamibacterales bacterium]